MATALTTDNVNSVETTGEQQSFSNFCDQALFWLDQLHPQWKAALNAEFGQCDTICIPDSMDAKPNKYFGPIKPAAGFDKQEVKRAKSRLKDEKAEETFFSAFRQLKLGGILLHGFYSQDFIKVMSDSGTIGFSKELNDEWKAAEKQFECDFMFIHRRLGVVVFEVKGCDREIDVIGKYKEAAQQLNRIIRGLKEIYQIMSAEFDCSITVHGIACMPCFDVTASSKPTKMKEIEDESCFHLIDKSVLLNAESFNETWDSMLNESFILTDNLIKFFAVMFAYRRVSFMSSPCNAMEIYRRIEMQDFSDAKKNRLQAIFYNSEQLKTIECNAERILISGAPGTGKTLCLLQRAVNATKIEKPGRVILLLYIASSLATKFKHECTKNKSTDMKRAIDVIDSLDETFENYSVDDDLFLDETDVVYEESYDVEFQSRLAGRQLRHGSTTVVVTGWNEPKEVAEMTNAHKIYANFAHFELKTVIRGTKSIISEWMSNFPDRFIRIGHNITGTDIERYSPMSYPEMLEIVQLKLRFLLTHLPTVEAPVSQRNKSDQWLLQQCSPSDIAILIVRCDCRDEAPIDFEHDTFLISQLSKFGTRCGSITEQVGDPTLIAVDKAYYSMSFEWPIVFVVVFTDGKYNYKTDSFYLIATSRAIAKLIVIDVILTNTEIKEFNGKEKVNESDESGED